VVNAAVVATVVLFCAVGCNYDENGKTKEPETQTTNVLPFFASGSTFIAPLITRWSADYEKSHPVKVNYHPIGSGGGIANLIAAWGSCTPGFSRAIAGSCQLMMSPAIVVVHRSDGSGTTNIFTNYLSKVSPIWSKKLGKGLAVEWPAGIGGDGSSAVLAAVKHNPGTIGYLELSYAKAENLAVASIQNRAGEFVIPTPQSAYLAVNAATEMLAQDVRTPVVDPPASAKGAYPITGLSFILIPKDNTHGRQEQQALKGFIAYSLSTGQDIAEQLSYAKLPSAVQKQGEAALAQLTKNEEPLK
jgi:ABC-type phosphate transport system substrate-binding protein